MYRGLNGSSEKGKEKVQAMMENTERNIYLKKIICLSKTSRSFLYRYTKIYTSSVRNQGPWQNDHKSPKYGFDLVMIKIKIVFKIFGKKQPFGYFLYTVLTVKKHIKIHRNNCLNVLKKLVKMN